MPKSEYLQRHTAAQPPGCGGVTLPSWQFAAADCCIPMALRRRGLNRSILRSIMSVAGEPQLKLLSPCYLAAHVLGTGGRSSSASDNSEPATEAAAPGADPEHVVEEEEEEEEQEVTCSRQLLPPTLLLHGTKDRCVPVAIAQQYAGVQGKGVRLPMSL